MVETLFGKSVFGVSVFTLNEATIFRWWKPIERDSRSSVIHHLPSMKPPSFDGGNDAGRSRPSGADRPSMKPPSFDGGNQL